MIVGVNTEVIAGEGLIITTGGMDAHVHFICPQICDEVRVFVCWLLLLVVGIGGVGELFGIGRGGRKRRNAPPARFTTCC